MISKNINVVKLSVDEKMLYDIQQCEKTETRNNKIYKTAIGINIYQWYTCNVGIRITKDILKFIYRNTNL